MDRRNDAEPNSAIQKRNKRPKIKIRIQINQQRDNILPDTFGLEKNCNKHEINDKKIHDLREEICDPTKNKPTLLR